MNSRAKWGLVAGALATWAISYKVLTDYVTRSSSVVKQTLFNLQTSPEAERVLGKDIKVTSSIDGNMNQIKGFANIAFDCTGSSGISILKVCLVPPSHFMYIGEGKINLVARRSGAVWETLLLSLRPKGAAEPINIISRSI